jgi:DNA glycosylase AlkZ-like
VLERLRPQLRTFRDERGRELFDLPEAPRPDPDTPAPVRFLPEYDNVLLSHADRSRFVRPENQREVAAAFLERGLGRILSDGQVRAVWRLDREPGGGPEVLTVRTFDGVNGREAGAIEAEAGRLLAFLAPGAPAEVRVVASDGGANVTRT